MKVDGIEVSIESSAAKANTELDKLIAKLGKVSSAIISTPSLATSGGGGSWNSASKSLKSYNTGLSKATKSTNSLAASFGKFYATFFLAIRGAKALGRAIESSMDYIETYNYYNVIMDKIGAEFGDAWKENGYRNAEEYADSFRERLNNLTTQMTGFKIGEEGGLYGTDNIGLGLDPEKIMSYQANISAVTNSLGLMGEVGTNTSKALTMLSADLSSLKNQNLETVMTNLQSGLIGQSRALYKYGIDITNNTLQTYAYANGIEKAVSEMTQAEKMQLRLLAILDQSKVAYGDMANTISGVANQYRIFQQQISNLARTIGTLFIPVIQKVLPYINGFIIALQKLFTWIGNLLGVDWSGLMDGISAGYSDSGIDGLADDAAGATDSLEDAKKAADKLKKSIFGYDELNIRADNSDSGSGSDSGSSGGIDLSGQIASALADYESVWNAALAGMENKAQAIADKITAAFTRMWKAIEPFRKAISSLWNGGLKKLMDFSGKALVDFYTDFLKPLSKWAVGVGLPNLVNHLNNVLNKFDWNKLNSQLKSFWKNIEPFAENIGNGLIQFLKDLISFSAGALSAIGNAIEWIGKALGFVNDYSPSTIEGIGYSIGVLVTAIWGFKKLASITEGITALSGSIAKMVVAHPYLAIATGLIAVTAAVEGFRKAAENREDIELYGDTVENISNRMAANTQSIKDNAAATAEYVNGAGLAEIAMAEDLADKYEILAGKTNLSSVEKQQLVDYSSQLVELIPDLASYINEETGALDIQSGVLDGIISKSKEYYTIKAAQEKLLSAYGDKVDAQIQLKDAENNLVIAKKTYEQAEDYWSYWEGLDPINQLFQDPFGTQRSEAQRGYENAKKDLLEYENSIKTANDAVVTAQTSVENLNSIIDGTKKSMEVTANGSYAIGQNVVSGYNEGILSKEPEAISTYDRFTSEMNSNFTKKLEINSPSKLYKRYGEYVVSGFDSGISGKESDSKGTVDTWASGISSWFTEICSSSSFTTIAENVVQGFNNGISGFYNTSKSAIQSWAQSVSNWFTEKFQINSPSKLFERFGEFTVEGFNDGIDNMLGDSMRTVDNWTRNISSMVSSPAVMFDASQFTAPDLSATQISGSNTNIDRGAISDTVKEIIVDAIMDVTLSTQGGGSQTAQQVGEIHVHHHTNMSETVEIYKMMKEAGRVGLIPQMT